MDNNLEMAKVGQPLAAGSGMRIYLETSEAAADANMHETKDSWFRLNQQLGDAVGKKTECGASSRT